MIILRSDPPAIFIAAVFGFFFFIIYLVLLLNKRNYSKAWDNIIAVADQLGIPASKPQIGVFKMPKPYLDGNYKGHHVVIYTEIRGTGKNRTIYTILNIGSPHAGQTEMHLSKEGFFAKIGKAFGMQDIQTGQDEFDKKFVLKCSDPNLALAVFDYNMCSRALEEHPFMWSGFHLRNGVFAYTETGLFSRESKRDRYVRFTVFLIEVSESIGKKRAR